MAERLANSLKDRRAELGLTQAELARRSGLAESMVSRWLRGLNQPDVPNLRRVRSLVPPNRISNNARQRTSAMIPATMPRGVASAAFATAPATTGRLGGLIG